MARTSKPQGTTAVGYVRVSTEDQTLSVAAQRARVASWCAERHLTLVAMHEDVGISGGADLDKCNGLQSKPAGTAISAFSGPH